MSRSWSPTLFIALLTLLAAMIPAAPAVRAQSAIPGVETGYVSPPILLPVNAKLKGRYHRPQFAPITWPDLPERFCSREEKDAYLAELRRLLAVAEGNLALAKAHQTYVENLIRSATRGAGRAADYGVEENTFVLLVNYYDKVARVWRNILSDLAVMPVSYCQPGDGVPPLPLPPPPPASTAGLEGYFAGPIVPPQDPRARTLPPRPTFIPIDYPPVATKFCSEAEKQAYLAQIRELMEAISVNRALAYRHWANLMQELDHLRATHRDAEAEALAAEAALVGILVDYYRDVSATWSALEDRVRYLPVSNCEPPTNVGRNPLDLSDIDLAGLSDAELAALGEAINAAFNPRFPPSTTGSFGLDIFGPFLVGSNPPFGLPKRFCTEAERLAYLTDVYHPLAAQASKDAVYYARRLAELSDAIATAVARRAPAAEIEKLKREHAELAPIAALTRERAQTLIRLRDQILLIPIVACDEDGYEIPQPDAEAPPPPEPPLDEAAAARIDAALADLRQALTAPPIPPLSDAAMRDYLGFGMGDLLLNFGAPTSFCSEAKRLAFLTEVFHPVAQDASRDAVEAGRRLAEITETIDQLQPYADLGNPLANVAIAALKAEYADLAVRADFYREYARKLIRLRDDILKAPIVPCPEDGNQNSDDPTPPADDRPLPPPATAVGVRPNTSLEEDVLREINLLRADPAAYAATLGGVIRGVSPAAVAEAKAALQAASPAPPLEFDPRLAGAAIGHADDIGPPGLTSHTGTDGSTLGGRIRSFGLIATLTAEELSYGQSQARAVVVQLVIDAGVAGAPHRRDLLNPVFRRGGVGCGPHKTYKSVCVITLSGPPFVPGA